MVRHHGKHFEATSNEGTEHFMTFLAMPSRSEKILDRCGVCPSCLFLSKTKKAKYYWLFHPIHKIPKSTSTEKKSKVHKCNYKENGIQCNTVFPSYHKLKQHKDLAYCSLRRVWSHAHEQAHMQVSLCVQFITLTKS